MSRPIPFSPFATRLSGSAGETELRIRSIFQWKRQRPPIWVMVLTVLLIALCGSLVSCQPRQKRQVPSIVMSTQYYDGYGHCLEVPRLTVPQGQREDAEISSINQGLAELDRSARVIMEQPWWRSGGQLCLFYPSISSRYLNLTFFLGSTDSRNWGGTVRTWVYDFESGRQIDGGEALAGVTLAGLRADLEKQIAADPMNRQSLLELSLCGFRMGEECGVELYLSARMASIGDGEYVRLYLWSGGVFTCWKAPYSDPERGRPLVPAGETSRMSPPLWSQWYFAGEEPEGGFTHHAPTDEDVSLSLQLLSTDMRTAYAQVLELLLRNNIAPDGSETELAWYAPERNQFAVFDVDGDGEAELIINYFAAATAGDRGFVLDYDHKTGKVTVQLEEYPLLTFFDNGTVMAGWSHNQGWAGKFWPYTLYQYQPSWDSYAQVGTVDAWDRTISDENEDNGFPPYPQELDVSGTGFLYYIDANGKHHSSDPVDASAYKAWLDPYVNGASVLLLPNLPLTEENIERLRRGV